MTKAEKYQPSEKGQAFLDTVNNGKYDRQIITGMKKFMDGNAPEDMQSFYTAVELQAISDLKGTAKFERHCQRRRSAHAGKNHAPLFRVGKNQ